jgi:hypothetical protein
MPRIDSYPNLDNTTVATDDEFVVWDTSGSQVANLPLSALDVRFAPATAVASPINRSAAGVYANFPVNGGSFSTTSFNVNGNCFFSPMMLAIGRTADRIGFEVTGAGTASTSLARLGIWSNTDGAPGTLLLDAGTVLTDSTGVKEITISQALVANTVYWLGVAQQGAPATVATIRCVLGTSQAMIGSAAAGTPTGIFAQSITGALASSPTLSTSASNSGAPRIFLRFT